MLLLTLGLARNVQAGLGQLLHDTETMCLYTLCANVFHCIAVAAQVICETSSVHAVIWQEGTSKPLCQVAWSPAHSLGNPGQTPVSPMSPIATQIACAKIVISIHGPTLPAERTLLAILT